MISHKFVTSVVVFLCFISNSLLKELPDYIQPCKRDPSTIDSCILDAIEKLKPQLLLGIKEIDVPALEPLLIPEVNVVSPGSMPLRASAHNLKVTGAGDFKVKSLTVDMNDGQTFTFKVRIFLRKLHFEGDYKMDTQLLLLPMTGQGKLNADAVKCDADVVLHAQVFSKDGTDYLKFNKIDTDINVKDYRIKLDGLFNGDKTLGEATNAAINQNRGEFLKSTKPHLEKTVSKMVLGVANKVVDGLTLDQLLPKP